MFCPRCGRPVSRTANFCGGCGLPKTEIERMTQPVDKEEIANLDDTLSQLEGDLTGINPVVDYTTETTANTNIDDILSENKNRPVVEFENISYSQLETDSKTDVQSDYSANAPVHPMYERQSLRSADYEDRASAQSQMMIEKDHNLTTVDFVWMLLVSGIPIVGRIYLIYQAFVQQENINRRSWARATLIVSLFAFVLAMVFFMGLFMTSFLYW